MDPAEIEATYAKVTKQAERFLIGKFEEKAGRPPSQGSQHVLHELAKEKSLQMLRQQLNHLTAQIREAEKVCIQSQRRNLDLEAEALNVKEQIRQLQEKEHHLELMRNQLQRLRLDAYEKRQHSQDSLQNVKQQIDILQKRLDQSPPSVPPAPPPLVVPSQMLPGQSASAPPPLVVPSQMPPRQSASAPPPLSQDDSFPRLPDVFPGYPTDGFSFQDLIFQPPRAQSSSRKRKSKQTANAPKRAKSTHRQQATS